MIRLGKEALSSCLMAFLSIVLKAFSKSIFSATCSLCAGLSIHQRVVWIMVSAPFLSVTVPLGTVSVPLIE